MLEWVEENCARRTVKGGGSEDMIEGHLVVVVRPFFRCYPSGCAARCVLCPAFRMQIVRVTRHSPRLPYHKLKSLAPRDG